MLYSPRIGAIWARYGNTLIDAGEIESAFEKADDHWDSTDPLTFWLCVIFCPYYPQFQLAIKYHESDNSFLTDHMDTVFYWSMLTKVIRDLLWLLVSIYPGKRESYSRGSHISLTDRVVVCVWGEAFFLGIICLFYCLWSVLGMLLLPHIVGGLSDLVFFSQVYLLLPFLFFVDWVVIPMLLAYPTKKKWEQVYTFGPLFLPLPGGTIWIPVGRTSGIKAKQSLPVQHWLACQRILCQTNSPHGRIGFLVSVLVSWSTLAGLCVCYFSSLTANENERLAGETELMPNWLNENWERVQLYLRR
jgi:hypothetical protein